MTSCSFCSRTIEKGTGIMYVLTDGKILNFCSSKCQKNMLKLKRKQRDFKWALKDKKDKK